MNVSVNEFYNQMKPMLSRTMPDAEIFLKAELVSEIEELKREKNAVILGHNYMEPALYHTVADIKGDSLALARESAKTNADVIVCCGVEFMAETTKILNPSKTVLVPSDRAGCSLASSITAEDVRKLKTKYPGVPVVTYVNTYADVKAETDICCTSQNAVKIVQALDSDSVIFLPDEYLAKNVARETGKKIIVGSDNIIANQASGLSSGDMVIWNGKCEVHDLFTPSDVQSVKKQFPDVEVIAHPECRPEVVELADFCGSTSAMISHVQKTKAEEILLLTECAMGDNIMAENPDKNLLRMCSIRCPHMAQITLEMTRDALKYGQFEVSIDEDIRVRAKRSLDRMLELS